MASERGITRQGGKSGKLSAGGEPGEVWNGAGSPRVFLQSKKPDVWSENTCQEDYVSGQEWAGIWNYIWWVKESIYLSKSKGDKTSSVHSFIGQCTFSLKGQHKTIKSCHFTT